MIKWFRRKINNVKKPAIKITLLSDQETKIEVEWPYIDPDQESNKDLALKAKQSMAVSLAKAIVAMEKGGFTPFLLQKASEYGVSINDKASSIMIFDMVNYILSGANKEDERVDKKKTSPLIKPNEVFDIRSMMMRSAQSGGDNE
jgi:hypothetical protein